ncbi:unnamed protein product [Pleuronectes platessa]|uniref:Uncharacterized protein n=1 Tax=Pleuronectes platessa TaxID=8262 RepID=A0A9N7TLA8_PLEPL|nr:unnamed protein product [Pleuronectes platessa]
MQTGPLALAHGCVFRMSLRSQFPLASALPGAGVGRKRVRSRTVTHAHASSAANPPGGRWVVSPAIKIHVSPPCLRVCGRSDPSLRSAGKITTSVQQQHRLHSSSSPANRLSPCCAASR